MVNKVILIGNVGKDPEIRQFDTGKSLARFSLATSDQYKNRNQERVTETEWHNIVAWSPQAEVVEKYIKKGTKLYIEGKIKSRSYEDEAGAKKYFTEIVVRSLQMLDSKRTDDQGSQYPSGDNLPKDTEAPLPSTDEAEDLPF